MIMWRNQTPAYRGQHAMGYHNLENTPLSWQYFKDLTSIERFFLGVTCVLSVVTLGLYVMGIQNILRTRRRHWPHRTAAMWILSVLPVTSVCCVISLCLPRSTLITDLVAAIFFSLGLLHFVLELKKFYSRAEVAIQVLAGNRMPVSSPPLCFLKLCCVSCSCKMEKKYILVIAILLVQSMLLQPIIAFTSAITFVEEKYQAGHFDVDSSYLLLTSIRIASTLSGVYGLSLVAAANQSVARTLNVTPKQMILKMWLLLVNLQHFILDVLAHYEIPPNKSISSAVRGRAIFNMILITEVTIITSAALHLFSLPDTDKTNPGKDEALETRQAEHVQNGGGKVAKPSPDMSRPRRESYASTDGYEDFISDNYTDVISSSELSDEDGITLQSDISVPIDISDTCKNYGAMGSMTPPNKGTINNGLAAYGDKEQIAVLTASSKAKTYSAIEPK